MIKITGLDKLQSEFKEAQRALGDLDGQLGTVHFDPRDPSSIEAAIQSVSHMIDQRTFQYASNPIVASLINQMKEEYRESIVSKAAAARLEFEEEK